MLRRLAPVAGLVAALALLYAPLFSGAVSFTRDPANWNYPARVFVREALRRGDAWTWNPLQGFGLSTVTNPLYGVFYPPNWLYLIGNADTVVHVMSWQSFAHTLWGGLGVMALARRFGCRPVAALLGALAWSLSGYISSVWTAGLLLLADAWVPWCGLAGLTLARVPADASTRRWARAVAGAAIAPACALLMGELFVALMGFGFGAAVFALERWRAERAHPARRGVRLAAVAVTLVLAWGVATVSWRPPVAAAAGTDRGRALARDVAERCSVHPLRVAEMLAPLALGDPYGSYPAGRWVGERALLDRPLTYSLYCGAAALALALAALGRRQRRAQAIAGFGVLAFLIALGRHTPLHQIVRTVLPPLARMRYPEKYMVLVVTAFALLVSLGAERVLDGTPRGRRVGRHRAGVVLGALLLLAALTAVAPAALGTFLRRAALEGALPVLLLGAAVHLSARRPRAAPAVAVVVVALDLGLGAARINELTLPDFATTRQPATAFVHAQNPDAPAPPRAYRWPEIDTTLGRTVPVPTPELGQLRSMKALVYANAAFGVAVLPGYDAAVPSASRPLWKAVRGDSGPVLRLLATPFALLPTIPNESEPARTGLAPALDVLPGARLYRVGAPLPRAYVAYQVRPRLRTDVDELLAPALLDGTAVTLPPSDAAAYRSTADAAPATRGRCTIDSFSNAAVSATCIAERPGLAVIAEQWDPGWSARVDGETAPVWRANDAFRAVPIAAGTHHIAMTFVPPGLASAKRLSAAALVGWLLLLGYGISGFGRALRRARSPGSGPSPAAD